MLEKQTENLGLLPRKGRIIPELKKQNIYRYRELIQSPWRIFYKTKENKGYILAVIDVRRNVEDLLLGRQLR